jgi:hypothetical protein
LDLSVEVTFKDGHKEIFDSPTSAAEGTGLTEASIKTRCSRKGAGSKSKDGITCMWANEHTRKSKQAKRSKTKGNGFELEIINDLKEIGYTGCVSSRSQNKMADADKIDIVDLNGELPVNIQSKYTQNTPSYFAIRDACSDKSKPFVVVWKKASDGETSPGAVAMIPLNYFYQLIKK